MKKFKEFVVNSLLLYWGFFLTSTLCGIFVQTIMRMFIEANSKGEYIWRTIYFYIWMVITCVIHLRVTSSTHKTKFLTHMRDKEWSLGGGIKYILKNSDFWLNSIGFAIWPIIIPKFSGGLNLCYFSQKFIDRYPKAVLNIFTVSIPIIILSAVGWMLVLYQWNKNRLHTT